MNYSEITALALSYADRSDTTVSDRMDDFLKIVEARINRKLKTDDMTLRHTITITSAVRYTLPTDFAGARDVQYVNGSARTTMVYATPEFMTGISDESDLNKKYYTIINGEIEINQGLTVGEDIEIVYYQRVPALTSLATTNWVSNYNPDCYTFGLMVEIMAFLKDAVAKELWDVRFKESLEDMKQVDLENRWSGPQLVTSVG
jgi:hypothetical protein